MQRTGNLCAKCRAPTNWNGCCYLSSLRFTSPAKPQPCNTGKPALYDRNQRVEIRFSSGPAWTAQVLLFGTSGSPLSVFYGLSISLLAAKYYWHIIWTFPSNYAQYNQLLLDVSAKRQHNKHRANPHKSKRRIAPTDFWTLETKTAGNPLCMHDDFCDNCPKIRK